jgi:hypothetical protein
MGIGIGRRDENTGLWNSKDQRAEGGILRTMAALRVHGLAA